MRRASVFAGVVLAVAGCTLATSLSGLSGGEGKSSETEGGVSDLRDRDASSDVQPRDDASPKSDAGPDSGADDFFDDFNRSPSSVLGNGWFDKTPGSFSLNGMEVVKTGGFPYPIVVAYRPPTEDILDVEVSADITISCDSGCFPGLVARIVSSAVNTPDHYLAYDFFVGGRSDTARLGNPHLAPGDFTGLRDAPISPPLQVGQPYRFIFRVTGTSPVTLDGTIKKPDGTIVARNTFVDSSASAISVPGSVGITGNSETGSIYDNFRRHPL